MKTLAVMQPYFLPYIGYFQLMAAVDKFVVFDDVSFINRGWINRNRLLLNGEAHMFTVPLQGASQNKRICDIGLVQDGAWREKLMRTIDQAYRRAPFYAPVAELVRGMLSFPERQLSGFLLNSLREVTGYLGLNVNIEPSSRRYENAALKGQERILDICRQEQARVYLNTIGGTELYERTRFVENGVRLHFVRPHQISYAQFGGQFLPWLSILDVMMFNSPQAACALLEQYDLV